MSGKLKWSSKNPGDIFDTMSPTLTIKNLTLGGTIKIKNSTAENISETPSAPLFNGYDIPGRSSPPQAYSGGETRTISFTMKLHRDLMEANSEESASKKFNSLLNNLRALNYPYYSSSGVVPPKVFVKYGRVFKIKGYATVTIELERPYDRWKRPMSAEVSFTISEVLVTSMDAKQVKNGKYVTAGSNKFR